MELILFLNIIENNHRVTVIDDLSTGHQKLVPVDIKLINCNINNKEITAKNINPIFNV